MKALRNMFCLRCLCAFRPTRRARALQQFSCTFSQKSILLTCPCAFQQRRLVQTVPPDLGMRHLFRQSSHQTVLLTCPCGFRLRRLAESVRREVLKLLVCGNFIVTSCMTGLLWRSSPTLFQKRSLHEDPADAILRGVCV